MPSYMVQVAYTSESWAGMVKKPQDRTVVVGKVIEKLGGTLASAWFAFGEYDVICILEMPDNVTAAAFAAAVAAGGGVKAIKTTPLLSIADGMESMKKAGGAGYKPPK